MMRGCSRYRPFDADAVWRALLRDASSELLERALHDVELHLDLARAMELHFVGVFEAGNRLAQGVEDDVALVEDIDDRVVFRACDVHAIPGTFDAPRLRDRPPDRLSCLCHNSEGERTLLCP